MITLSIYLSVCLSIYLCIYPSIYLSITLSIFHSTLSTSIHLAVFLSINRPLPYPKYQYIIAADPGAGIGFVTFRIAEANFSVKEWDRTD